MCLFLQYARRRYRVSARVTAGLLGLVGAAALGAVGATPAMAQTVDLQRVTASDAEAGSAYGASVAVSGDTAVVGARYADCAAGENCGAAYVYRQNGDSWLEQQRLTAPLEQPYNGFGRSVAVSGDTAIVGAGGESCASGNLCGSAYVFRFDGISWVSTQRLTASDAAAIDSFGATVAISGDVAIIGAVGVDCAGPFSDCGAAYVFRFNGATWVEEQKLTASDIADHDGFAGTVSIDGNVVVVGATKADCAAGADCGAAYVFRFNGFSWVEEQKLTSSDAARNVSFGSASVFGDTIVVGARGDGCAVIGSAGLACGSAYVFQFDGTNWVQKQKLFASDPEPTALFGASVSLQDGAVVIAAPQKDCDVGFYCGAAYVFRFDGTTWTQQRVLTAIERKTDDNFAIAVGTSAGTAVMGGLLSDCVSGQCGSAYIYSGALRAGTVAPIPTASTWGLASMTLLLLTAGTAVIRRKAIRRTGGRVV